MILVRATIVFLSLAGAVERAEHHGDALCILALGVVLFLTAGIFDARRRK